MRRCARGLVSERGRRAGRGAQAHHQLTTEAGSGEPASAGAAALSCSPFYRFRAATARVVLGAVVVLTLSFPSVVDDDRSIDDATIHRRPALPSAVSQPHLPTHHERPPPSQARSSRRLGERRAEGRERGEWRQDERWRGRARTKEEEPSCPPDDRSRSSFPSSSRPGRRLLVFSFVSLQRVVEGGSSGIGGCGVAADFFVARGARLWARVSSIL